MVERHFVTVDANTATAHVAHAVSEVIAIYPITPSSLMGELADEKSSANEKNIWGTVPRVVEMQSEGGAAGAVHGALTTGALATTFMLMIPNMYKIAGELTPTVFHIAARAIAAHALSIFGDHSDVMAVRQTGWAMLNSSNVQEAMDMALIAHAATLKARVPFVHFFDGFRTSSEIQKIEELTFDDMRTMIDDDLVAAHRMRGLNPERPVMRGSAQDPDVFFQSREAANVYYRQTGAIVQEYMNRLAALVGRQYHLFDYYGAPDADRVVVVMGSAGETLLEVADYLNARGEKVGVLKVRLYRPFVTDAFIAALPKTVRRIAVLDRTKESGSAGEPLYQDVRTALYEALEAGSISSLPQVVGGRYGLGSKEFDAAMAKAVFDNLLNDRPKNNFTVGINDDVTNTSLPYDPTFSSEPAGVHTAMFYGLGADGTVGANKNTIKIIAKATDFYTQGYFVYDSKKSGSMTTSHLRFSRQPIRSVYLVKQADFLACHNFSFLERFDMLSKLKPGGTFLLNAPHDAKEVWQHLPGEVQQQLIDKRARFFVIDALKLAKSLGLGGRINTTMQAAFFSISGVLPQEQALEMIKLAIEDTYGDKGQAVVDMNVRAAMLAVERVQEVIVPNTVTNTRCVGVSAPVNAPEFVKNVTMPMVAKQGDLLPVSALPIDGTFPTGTSKFEKRNIASEIPVWESDICIQCNQCSYVCPHAAIRVKIYDEHYANGSSPATFKSTEAKGREFTGMRYTVQVAPEDCTGCGVCVEICPAFEKINGQKTDKKAINMAPQAPLREPESKNWEHFLSIPDLDLAKYKVNRFTVKGSQLLPPLFEFSGACSGCGETPYIKLISQLYGDHTVIANATGCSSIYGGNLPTTPYTTRSDGRGPAWSNSLFEDNAEFGLGMRLTLNKLAEYAFELLDRAIETMPDNEVLLTALRDGDQSTPEGIEEQRARVAQLKTVLETRTDSFSKQLLAVADNLIKRSVWIFGGDGWAYDIGYGGLDHVLASGQNVNVMVLDTGVYSNTGGQMSKATPRGAVAKFAAAGKPLPKKDLGLIAISYGNVYVAQIAMGANMTQAVTAIKEAEAYNGPSLIITYSHCIMQGIDILKGNALQSEAVDSGFWPLYRYNPDAAEGKNPFTLDSKGINIEELESYLYKQTRFNVLRKSDPERAQMLSELIHKDVLQRWNQYQMLAKN
ncbi:MAG: pyruvate:ferredoxin (flavodoxin) oxidoreductase [Chloroflexi bacterium]|nr:pyruvate:ferredoxin (flavodoxin) oxidoreductase [Chloroflexota bacterium]